MNRSLMLVFSAALLACDPDTDATFRGGPIACASPDLATAYVDDECADGDWFVGAVGTFYEEPPYRVCCPWHEYEGCRVITNGSSCSAVEEHVADRYPEHDTHACLNGSGLYIQPDLCSFGDTFVCAEGNFDSPISAVCCGPNATNCAVDVDGVCPQDTSALCMFDGV
jgi:hypothetical protein